ncbi:MAG: ammonia-forming cytochrome c nitrite reductase subunit c552 [Deltaproteobacteria bacterium]|nr:ammonia-forming cytochrome c nitrite reductase subunit c552 [Deltaproteobacteria bacterium]
MTLHRISRIAYVKCIIAVALLAGCGGSDASVNPVPASNDASAEAAPDTSIDAPTQQDVSIEPLPDTVVADQHAPDAEAGSLDVEPPKDAATAQCSNCHIDHSAAFAAGKHAALSDGCLSCHANGLEHQADPPNVQAALDHSIEGCAEKCHGDYKSSYLKDDGLKIGPYGGSAKTSKYLEFPKYQHLMGGHGFTLEYNEERGHGSMLKDHIEIKRKQNSACLQCKSTPVAYLWNKERRGQIAFGKAVDWNASVDKIKVIAPKTIDYGAGCNHCHDPHGASFRLVRGALVSAILERGTDPYSTTNNVFPKSESDLTAMMNERGTDGKYTAAAKRLAGTLTCSQCHVEYTCGQGIDKPNGPVRDDFPWRKLSELEGYYKTKYNLIQDWKHSGTGLPGIKAQHPESEFFWSSKHASVGATCADCHMPKTATGRSHWFSSPRKSPNETCGTCHTDPADRLTLATGIQTAVMTKASAVEAALDAVLVKIEALASDPSFDQVKLAAAKDHFMRGLLWWEFTVVSENSAGFHNPTEADANLSFAASEADAAKVLLGI